MKFSLITCLVAALALLRAPEPAGAGVSWNEAESALQEQVAVGRTTLSRERIASRMESFVGPALYSFKRGKYSVERQGGASVLKDHIRVPHTGKTFTRYAFLEEERSIILTIYKDDQGRFFSYGDENFVLMTEEEFLKPLNTNPRNLEDCWVELKPTRDRLTGAFYATDTYGRENISVTFERDAVIIEKQGRGQVLLLPTSAPAKVYRFERAPASDAMPAR